MCHDKNNSNNNNSNNNNHIIPRAMRYCIGQWDKGYHEANVTSTVMSHSRSPLLCSLHGQLVIEAHVAAIRKSCPSPQLPRWGRGRKVGCVYPDGLETSFFLPSPPPGRKGVAWHNAPSADCVFCLERYRRRARQHWLCSEPNQRVEGAGTSPPRSYRDCGYQHRKSRSRQHGGTDSSGRVGWDGAGAAYHVQPFPRPWPTARRHTDS